MQRPRLEKSLLAGLTVALIAAGGTVLPAGPAGATAPGEVRLSESIAACEIADATLNWGTIERWRAYIQGSIAQGSWETIDDVSYEMPDFVWHQGTGILSVSGAPGTVSFEGGVNFTGHDDLLQVNVANPTLEIVDAEEAYLLLDLNSTKQDGTPDIGVTQERAVKLEIADRVNAEGGTLTFVEVPGKFTAEGAAAFGGFYAAGEAVDPVTVTVTAANGCEFIEATADAPDAETPEAEAPATESPATETPAETESEVPWLPIGVGAGALIVLLGAVIMLLRKPRNADGEGSSEQSAD